ncbi:YbjN domain-containing protein [Corynebacterium pacaense]|uniref:YbjN domain-containing protein n=1 Tax=Corynebacterium pacaense TaxID=1816684 RepID=UPI0009BB018F|nr:YbjN domain-containing protein [Corynebacterium pacaense]
MTEESSPHEVRTLRLDTVARILDEEQLDYRREEHGGTDVIRTGFINAAISIAQLDGALAVEAMWRGMPPTAQAAEVLAATNEWNLTQFAPTLRFFEAGEGTLAINGVRQISTGSGISYNQTGAFIMSTLDATIACFTWLEQQFPELVTWEDNHDDHV